MQSRLAVLAASLVLHAAVQAAHAPTPLDVKLALSLRSFAAHESLAVSPDGKLLAYSVARPRQEQRQGWYTATGAAYVYSTNDIWLTETQSGESRNLTGEHGGNWGAAWSPDGRALAFYSDRGGKAELWIWERDTNTLRRISEAPIRSLYGLQWLPNGQAVLVGIVPKALLLNANEESKLNGVNSDQKPTVRVFRNTALQAAHYEEPKEDVSHLLTDLALIDVHTGSVRRVAERVHAGNALLSPDGAHLVYANVLAEHAPKTHLRLSELKLIALAQGTERTLVPKVLLANYGLDISWSPDSEQVAYRAGGYDASQAYVASLTGETREVARLPHPLFKGRPVWDEGGRTQYFLGEDALWRVTLEGGIAQQVAHLPGKVITAIVTRSANRDRIWLREGGRSVLVAARDAFESGIYRIDLQSGGVRPLFEQAMQFGVEEPALAAGQLVAAPQLQQIFYVAQDAQHPPDLWRLAGNLRTPHQLTRLNPEISTIQMGKRRIIEWVGRDGKRYHGVLLLPSSYRSGVRYPLITYVYPIDTLPSSNKFGVSFGGDFYNLQLLATRGYAVLFAGGSVQPADREPMQAIAEAVLPGIDRVIELGIADPERLGVFGGSAGGYVTLALIVQSTRFKAAVAHAAPGNILSLYGDLQDNGYSHGLALAEASFQMPDHPWKERERYIRNSPWFFLDKVETPLLLLHGTEDTGTIVTQANEIYLGLRRLGKEVEYARYDGEGHGFSALVNAVDAAERYIAWFNCHLKDPPMSALQIRREPGPNPESLRNFCSMRID